jgi:hydrogenase maturation protease
MSGPAASLCILGIGNTLRSDDGIGAYVCNRLARLPLKNTVIEYAHQLQTEWLETLSSYEAVVLVDAHADERQEVSFHPLGVGTGPYAASSHYLDAGILAALAGGMFPLSPTFRVCSIPGYDFSLGEGLSPRGMQQADEAYEILRRWLTDNGYLSETAGT